MSRVIHFEIGSYDPERTAKFYESVFGWQFQKWGGPMDYWLITTGAEGTPGINGGMNKFEAGAPLATVNTVGVESVDAIIEKITEQGGKVVHPKMAIPGVGYLAYCQDTEGNTFGVIQNDPSAQ
jgi:predicted enzyme related to lactoylglutathione lyase